MSNELHEGAALKAVHVSETLSYVVDFPDVEHVVSCKSIVVVVQSGRMSGVPWAKVELETGAIILINLANVESVELEVKDGNDARQNDLLRLMDEIECVRSVRRHETVRELCPLTCDSLRKAIEQQQARIARLELGLYEIHALADGGESSMQDIANVCQAWLNEHPRQSVAEIRAQELEQWAHNAMNEAPTSDHNDK
jgi:hypothetical protein